MTSNQHAIRGRQRLLHAVTLISLLFALVAAAAAFPGSARAAGATTTSDLNLRSGPGLDWRVLRVMPEGVSVEILDGPSDGFYNVTYDGSEGWAFGDYLSFGGGSGVSDGPTGPAATTSDLNLRSGPSTGFSVILVMPPGAAITLTGQSSNGFSSVIYGGTSGWAFADYIGTDMQADDGSQDPGGGDAGSATVTSALNLRAGPSTGTTILSVMPEGAVVTLTGAAENGFSGVIYGGLPGWAYDAYLSSGGDDTSGDDTSGGDTSGGDVVSTIYAAAARYGQSGDEMLRVASCESGLDPNAQNPYSNASGLFQFLPGTWATTPYAGDNIFDAWSNANAAGWMWSVGRRNEWVCQ